MHFFGKKTVRNNSSNSDSNKKSAISEDENSEARQKKHLAYQEKFSNYKSSWFSNYDKETWKEFCNEDEDFIIEHLSEYLTPRTLLQLDACKKDFPQLYKLLTSRPAIFSQIQNISEESLTVDELEKFIAIIISFYKNNETRIAIDNNPNLINDIREEIKKVTNFSERKQLLTAYLANEKFVLKYPISYSESDLRTVGELILKLVNRRSWLAMTISMSQVYKLLNLYQNSIPFKELIQIILNFYINIVKKSLENSSLDEDVIRVNLVNNIIGTFYSKGSGDSRNIKTLLELSPFAIPFYIDCFRFKINLDGKEIIDDQSFCNIFQQYVQEGFKQWTKRISIEQNELIGLLNVSDRVLKDCYDTLERIDPEMTKRIRGYYTVMLEEKILFKTYFKVLQKLSVFASSKACQYMRDQYSAIIKDGIEWDKLPQEEVIDALRYISLLSDHDEEYCKQKLQEIHDNYTMKQHFSTPVKYLEWATSFAQRNYGSSNYARVLQQELKEQLEHEQVQQSDIPDKFAYALKIINDPLSKKVKYDEACLEMAELIIGRHVKVIRGIPELQLEDIPVSTDAVQSEQDASDDQLRLAAPNNIKEKEKEKDETKKDETEEDVLEILIQLLEFLISNKHKHAIKLKNEFCFFLNGNQGYEFKSEEVNIRLSMECPSATLTRISDYYTVLKQNTDLNPHREATIDQIFDEIEFVQRNIKLLSENTELVRENAQLKHDLQEAKKDQSQTDDNTKFTRSFGCRFL